MTPRFNGTFVFGAVITIVIFAAVLVLWVGYENSLAYEKSVEERKERRQELKKMEEALKSVVNETDCTGLANMLHDEEYSSVQQHIRDKILTNCVMKVGIP